MEEAPQSVVFKARPNRKIGVRGFSMYERDYQLVDALASHLGCSRSEAVRTSVRAMYAALTGGLDGTPRLTPDP